MKKREIELILEDYGRINNVGPDDRVNVLQKIEEETISLGLEYDYYRKAILASALENDTETVTFSNRAIDEAIKSSNNYILVEVQMFLGIHYRMNNQYDDAFKYYIASIKVKPTARAYNNLADLYLLIGAYEEANALLKKALIILDKIDELSEYDRILYNTIYSNQAEVDLKAGHYEEATKNALAVIELSKATDDLIGVGIGYNLLGNIELLLESYDTALKYLHDSEAIFNTSTSSSRNQVKGYIEEVIYLEAECYYGKHMHLESISKLKHLEVDRSRNYKLLIANYEALGDETSAYRTFKQYMDHLKSDEDDKAARQKSTFKTSVEIYETEKKASEYELLYSNTKSISEIGRQIIAAEKLDDVFQAIYNHIDKIMEFDALSLAVIEDEIIHFNWVMDQNEKLDAFKVELSNKNSFSSWVARNKKSIKINDAMTSEEVKKYKEDGNINWYGSTMNSMLTVPIMIKDTVLGIISVQCEGRFKYNEYDLEVINMLASFIGVAMKNWKDTLKLKEANEKLEQLSKTDALTGISNRHILSEIVEDLFKSDGTGHYNISVVMIDIDHFKEYNDTYGHVEGDRCIIEIVNQLRIVLDDDNNRLFRYGGDEFVAIVPFIDEKALEQLLDGLRLSIESLAIVNKGSKVSDYVTCTFGYTTVKKGQHDYQRAFYLADEALYMAKAAGKNRIGYIPDEA